MRVRERERERESVCVCMCGYVVGVTSRHPHHHQLIQGSFFMVDVETLVDASLCVCVCVCVFVCVST